MCVKSGCIKNQGSVTRLTHSRLGRLLPCRAKSLLHSNLHCRLRWRRSVQHQQSACHRSCDRTARKATGPVQSSRPTLGFGSLPPQNFNNDSLQVRQAVYDWEAWAAIIINPNATALLYEAIETGNRSYDPRGACQYVYMASRDNMNYYNFILPIMNEFLQQAMATAGRQWASIAMERAAADPAILANIQAVPQAINPAIGFSQYNLRPLYPYTTLPSVTIGLICMSPPNLPLTRPFPIQPANDPKFPDLIIVSFFSFSFYLPIHIKYLKLEGHPPLKFWQLIL